MVTKGFHIRVLQVNVWLLITLHGAIIEIKLSEGF